LIEPFADFLRRYGKQAVCSSLAIAVYRIGVVMGIIGQPVLCGHGLHQGRSGSRDQDLRRHHDGGAFAGGALAIRFGVMRVLMLGAVVRSQ
jgi:PAT family beta-lactamase induction signal transducer AmpG